MTSMLNINDKGPEPKTIGRFGSSTLYEWGRYVFHPRAFDILCKRNQLVFRKNDIVLSMFPKSGSTWLSECIYLITYNYNYELALKMSIEYRFPQIDSPSHDVFDLIVNHYEHSIKDRLIKSSVPPTLLTERDSYQKDIVDPVAPRVISVLRNPRDVLVSFYHHCKSVKHYDIDLNFDEFYETFLNGKIPCGPIWLMYNDMYKYHKANPETSMLIFYEDMKQDLKEQIRKLCDFLDYPEPPTEEAWAKLLDHLSVDSMRKNHTINRHDWVKMGLKPTNGYEFVRKGVVNDWKNFFNERQSLRFDQEITNKLVPELRSRYGPQRY